MDRAAGIRRVRAASPVLRALQANEQNCPALFLGVSGESAVEVDDQRAHPGADIGRDTAASFAPDQAVHKLTGVFFINRRDTGRSASASHRKWRRRGGGAPS
jgi:hypothetical protein